MPSGINRSGMYGRACIIHFLGTCIESGVIYKVELYLKIEIAAWKVVINRLSYCECVEIDSFFSERYSALKNFFEKVTLTHTVMV